MSRYGVVPKGRTRSEGDRHRRTCRLADVQTSGALVDGVGHVVREIYFLRCRQIAQVCLHGGDVSLVLGVGELRNGNGGQDADDHRSDQQLD